MLSTRTPEDRSAARRLAALVAAGALLASLIVPTAANAALAAPDGLSAATAAASCWEIKQVTPTAPSGVYWIGTPAMGAPERFHCDQSTSGGGWVLVGRGREDWSTSNEGKGTPASVRGPITGESAFAPKQLSSKMIGALLNGAAVSSLPDGIRLRRATNTGGTSWQESRFKIVSPRVEWSWRFASEQRVGSWAISSSSGTGGQTNSFGSGTGLLRIEAYTGAPQGWKQGFGFGTSSRGTTSSTSYVWAPSTTAPNPRPFTQMYLRPKLLSSTFSAVPDAGTAKVENAPVAESLALPTVWGVNGLGAGPTTLEGSNEVSAFAEGNGMVYVGGNFLRAQRTSTGTGAIAQPYLAAFDVQTGEFVSSFRPVLNNQVKSLAVLPNGRLAVGGYFSTVNGVSRRAFVVLNPLTGATDAGYTTKVINNISGGLHAVRSLDVQGQWLYLAGSFTHMTGGTVSTQTYLRSGGRISVTDGTPDATWNPEFNGTVISMDASAKGDRAYFAGYFTTSKTATANKAAAINTATTSVIPWTVNFSNTFNFYQQAVREVGGRVWLGGAQHSLFTFDRATMKELSANIASPNGDFQTISTDGSVVYAGCHCFHAFYAGARTWPSVGTSWTEVSDLNSGGAWDAATGKRLLGFSPILSQRSGAGSYAMLNDSTGTTWFGGDFKGSVKAGFVPQWSGGFARFARNDAQAPTAPTDLTVTATAAGDALSWTGSTDNRGSLAYQILRNDRVIASTTTRTATVPTAPAGTKYFVRAADPSGNWSASTPAAVASTVAPPPDPDDTTLIGEGSAWSYYYSATDPATGWQARSYAATGWSTGAAPLGWGQADLGTTLTAATPKPLTSYYRKSFTVLDATTIASVALTTRSDDGIVVYVNGAEVVRRNIADVIVTSGTYATSSISASAALADPVTVTVPGSAFVTGSNVITAEVHSGYRATSSHSFELSAEATFGTQPPPPADPPADDPPADDPPADDPPSDTGAIPAGTVLVPPASTWSYYYDTSAPATAWNTRSFDISAWKTGPAPLGWGQSTLGTTLTAVDPKPLSSYFRRSFTVADPSKISALEFSTRADDGIILYLNGTELTRVNMPLGPVTIDTYATVATSASTSLSNPVVVRVPGSSLLAGTNVITAEVHSDYRATSSHSFELYAIVK